MFCSLFIFCECLTAGPASIAFDDGPYLDSWPTWGTALLTPYAGHCVTHTLRGTLCYSHLTRDTALPTPYAGNKYREDFGRENMLNEVGK